MAHIKRYIFGMKLIMIGIACALKFKIIYYSTILFQFVVI